MIPTSLTLTVLHPQDKTQAPLRVCASEPEFAFIAGYCGSQPKRHGQAASLSTFHTEQGERENGGLVESGEGNYRHGAPQTTSSCSKRRVQNAAGSVGAAGFEPATFCSQSRRASQAALRPASLPILSAIGSKTKPKPTDFWGLASHWVPCPRQTFPRCPLLFKIRPTFVLRHLASPNLACKNAS